ncbi:MAG: (Fe-S)-binding protein [Anaerolineales bacterium]
MRTVQLFITCLTDTFYPATGQAMVKIFRHLGIRVEFPLAQTCCGQPAFNAGKWQEAREMARHMIETFEQAEGDIVAPSGSCVYMVRHGYPMLFEEEPRWARRAEALAKRTFELSQYLVDVLGVVDLGAHWDGTLSYHPSCHLLRGLGIHRQPLELLRHVQEARLVALPNAEECCGFGGIFSVVMPELSQEMLQRKLDSFASTQADTLVVADSGCRLHLMGGLMARRDRRKVVHLAEVLASFSDDGGETSTNSDR